MNLSTYLQMPPAPPTAQGSQTQAAQGAAAVASAAVGASLGFDFAQVMAKQMVRFNPQQRQEFAVSGPAAQDLRVAARDLPPQRSTRDEAPDDEPRERVTRDTSDENDTSSSNVRPRPARRAADTSTQEINDPLAAAMTQIAAVVNPTAAAPTDTLPAVAQAEALVTDAQATVDTTHVVAAASPLPTEANAEPADDALSRMAQQLRTIELSPRVRLITAPQAAPNPESLVAFAQSMGLDDSAIQSLMTTNTATTPTSNVLVNPLSPSATAQALPQGLSGDMPADALQALTQNAVQSAQVSITPTVTTPTVMAGAELAQSQTLPAMSPNDMAAIQQLQVTVLPAAVALPMNMHLASGTTRATEFATEPLSLLGSHLFEQDIAELAAGFADSGSDMAGDTSSGDSAQSGLGFGQAMVNASSDNGKLSKAAATQASTPMSEVYDQLSDKLSTEMAARIHKQLSEGQWKMKFGLRPENLGGVEIQLEMKDGKLDAVFRADNPLTRDLLQNSSQRLRDALENFGIQAGLVHVGQDGAGAQQRQSGNSSNTPQVGHNSPTQVNDGEDAVATATDTKRNKANASLLDLYA
jgi:flagellar hook-length control protein FliK